MAIYLSLIFLPYLTWLIVAGEPQIYLAPLLSIQSVQKVQRDSQCKEALHTTIYW